MDRSLNREKKREGSLQREDERGCFGRDECAFLHTAGNPQGMLAMVGKEKGREGKGRYGKRREGKGRYRKGREGKGRYRKGREGEERERMRGIIGAGSKREWKRRREMEGMRKMEKVRNEREGRERFN